MLLQSRDQGELVEEGVQGKGVRGRGVAWSQGRDTNRGAVQRGSRGVLAEDGTALGRRDVQGLVGTGGNSGPTWCCNPICACWYRRALRPGHQRSLSHQEI